jgi:superfamily II DNA or RNA helicase
VNNCKLRILDQVNAKFEDIDPFVRRRIVEALKIMVPYARHMPAFKLGRWDGKVAFATVGGATYINLLERVLPIVMDAGYEIELVDERPQYNFSFEDMTEEFLAHKVWPEGHPFAGQPIIFRDYQVAAINTYLTNLQCIQSISTGAGKTLITAALSLKIEPYGRSIVIVPSKSLVEQTEEDYRNIGLDVGVFFGDRKEYGHTHTICTWQSLSVMAKNTRQGEAEVTIDEFTDGVCCVIVDETHSAQANDLKELLAGPLAHIPIRWGLTGTVPKEDYNWLAILSTLGPVAGEVRAADLQEQGVLAKCEVKIIQLQDEREFKTYPEELDFLTSDTRRIQWIADTCKVIAEGGNTLILVTRIETGEALTELIGDNAIFVSGAMKTKSRRKEYKEVQVSDGKVIVATYGVAAVGINIPRIFNLVLIEPGKSFVRTIQSVGRSLRTAADKDHATIYDITSSCKFSARHLTKRKSYYKEADYPFSVTKVTYK